jgi:nicotinamide-nucleotide amidase
MEALLPALRELLGEVIFAVGEVPLEQVVGQMLLERGLTVGTAESCTGGYVAYRLTSVPGSSRYFQGSIVAYSYEVKVQELGVQQSTLDQHGAVSEATVREMAEGLRRRLGVDVAIATSGIAGPGGGTPTKPVGTICMAYADKHQTVSRQISFDRGRQLNVEYTSTAALNLLRLSLPKA